MEQSKSLKIIGTNHLQDSKEIINEFKSFNPDIICIELDGQRMEELKNPTTSKKDKGTFWKYFSNQIISKSNKEGLVYGNDMVTAYNYAKENNIQLEYIDKPFFLVRKELERVKWIERMKFYLVMFIAIKSQKRMKDVQENASKITQKELDDWKIKITNAFPNIMRILTSDRETYMINRLREIKRRYPDKNIIVLVGKGHKEKIEQVI